MGGHDVALGITNVMIPVAAVQGVANLLVGALAVGRGYQGFTTRTTCR